MARVTFQKFDPDISIPDSRYFIPRDFKVSGIFFFKICFIGKKEKQLLTIYCKDYAKVVKVTSIAIFTRWPQAFRIVDLNITGSMLTITGNICQKNHR